MVACAIEGGIACVNLTMIRGGRHVGDRSFFPANAEGAAEDEVVAAFLEQLMATFYSFAILLKQAPGLLQEPLGAMKPLVKLGFEVF